MGKNKMKLFKENGQEAGLFDVCEWWIQAYPYDVFVNNPKEIVQMRNYMTSILDKRKK